MPAKYLSPQQEEERSSRALWSGLQGAAVGLGLGAVATVLTFRRSPDFRALSRPMQSMMAVSGASAGYLFGADRASSAYENRVLGYTDEEMVQHLQGGQHGKESSLLETINDNRWSIIGLSWATSMAGAFAYTFSNRYLTTQQKLVQSRMYAQAVTIVVLMASAGLSIYMGDQDKKNQWVDQPDPQLRAVLELPVEQKKAVSQPQ